MALELARDIACNTGPVAAAVTKRVLWEFLTEPDRAAARARQDQLFAWTGLQAEAKEVVMEFLDKRDPTLKLSKTSCDPEMV